jgi:hypothetical protein
MPSSCEHVTCRAGLEVALLSRVSEARFKLRCTAFGYLVIVHIAPEHCLMCRGSARERTGEKHRRHVASDG